MKRDENIRDNMGKKREDFGKGSKGRCNKRE